MSDREIGTKLQSTSLNYREQPDAERWLAAIVASSDDSIISKTMEGIITSWNAGAVRMFGYNPNEVLGQPIALLIPEELQHEEVEILERVGKGERIDHYETARLRKDGRRISVSLAVSPIRDASGKIVGISKIARDMTERKRLLKREEELNAEVIAEHKFHELIENAPDAILQVNPAGAIVIANRTAEAMFGYSREELIGGSVDMLVPTARRSEHPRHRQSFAAVGVTRPMGQGLELHARRKNGTEFPVEISLSPIVTEGGTNVTAVVRDVTERKLAEQQIRLLQQNYTAELEIRHREAERLNRLKSEFMASVSHELRTPLHTIIGFAELLGEEAAGFSEKHRRFLRHIQADSEHLLSLINDVLDLSKIEAGGLSLHTDCLSLHKVIPEAIEAIRPSASSKAVTMGEGSIADVAVIADPLRLRQILYNLLSNAVKFTESGGEVTVRSAVVGDSVQISVVDTGIGIPDEERGRIFDKFYQVGPTTAGVRQGTGLGLTICKQLVEMHGGEIWVESQPGQGSSFSFTLPIQSL